MSIEPIQNLIDQAIALEDKDHIKSGKFSPSLFGRCYRLQYWNRKGEPQSNPPDQRTLRVFKAGKLFHDFVQNLLVDQMSATTLPCGVKEIKVESDDVKGYADLVRDNEVVDVKSQHSKAFWYMSKFKGDDIKKEKYPNWLQVMYYARELKKDFGRLVFISKDDLCVNEYIQPLDDYWLIEISNELATLRKYWRNIHLPPALPRCYQKKDGSFGECQYCGYLDKCKKLEAENESSTNV